MLSITTRPAKRSDAEFSYQVEEDAMRKYAELTWGFWTPANEKESFLENFEPYGCAVIQLAGEDVGIIRTELRDKHLFLAQLYLRSSHRNQGIGANILGRVIAQAKEVGLPIKLHILAVNIRAQAFYTRYGFAIESQDKERVYLARAVHA
jgi:GNAT superfamily N-acetyltransferase